MNTYRPIIYFFPSSHSIFLKELINEQCLLYNADYTYLYLLKYEFIYNLFQNEILETKFEVLLRIYSIKTFEHSEKIFFLTVRLKLWITLNNKKLKYGSLKVPVLFI